MNGSLALAVFRDREGEKVLNACAAVAKPQRKRGPEPGARKGAAGQGSLSDGRRSGLQCPVRTAFTRSVREAT